MINVLIVTSKYLFNSPGLAIIVFTILIKVAMLSADKKQLLASKKMQDMQPKIQELQKNMAKINSVFNKSKPRFSKKPAL